MGFRRTSRTIEENGFFQALGAGTHYLVAFNITDGAEVWRKQLGSPFGSGQHPAVGYLYEGGPLALVAAIGMPNETPHVMYGKLLDQYLTSAEFRRAIGVRVSGLQSESFS